jgi:hypothetical protein
MKRSAQLAIGLGFVLLSVWVTWPLVLHIDEALPGDLGDPLLNTWILGWDADRLRHGLIGLWDAPIFFPYRRTLAFSEHLLGIGLPVAPIVWLTGRPFVAYNVAFIASFALAGIGMWRLARMLTGRDDAAIVAGAIFAFAPARLGHIGHLQVLMSGWMPLALIGLHRYIQTGSRRALAGFTIAFIMQGLSNGYYLYFLTVPVVILALHSIVTRSRSSTVPPMARAASSAPPVNGRGRLAAGFLVSAVCIVAVFAPIAAVYFEVRQTYGFERTEGEVTTFGADLGTYLHGNEALRPPIRIWRVLPHFDKPGGPEGEVFPGLMALVLAFAALWPRKRLETGAATRTIVALYAAIGASAVILSMGAQPTAWGSPVPIGAPYRWLFAYMPGFNGLRVPARFSTVVVLAIGVLASVGFARITERWPSRIRLAAATMALVFVVLEGTGGAMPLAFLKPHGRPDRAAYAWVRDAGPGAVLELPAGELDTRMRTYQYEYQALFHGHPLVNGASGYNSALHVFLGSAASPIVEPDYFGDALRMLREIGVRTVVVRPAAFDDPATGASIVDRFRRGLTGTGSGARQVTSEAVFPGVAVYRLAESSDNRVASSDAGMRGAISTAHFVATSSHAGDRLQRAFDGDIDTRWVSGERQSGGEWIDIAFDHPRDVARVRLLTAERSIGDYPRELVIESVAIDGMTRTLYRGTVIRQLAFGLIAEPKRGPIDIALPANATARLHIRQVGQTRVWFWAVDELTLFER